MENIIRFAIMFSILLFEEASAAKVKQDRLASLDPKIANLVRQALGSPYEYGALWSGPGTSTDCSGLVQGFLLRLGISCPRTTREILEKANREEARSLALKPLDVLVFSSYSSSGLHVGLHLGNGIVLHARKTGTVVEMFDLFDAGDVQGRYWKTRLIAVYRPEREDEFAFQKTSFTSRNSRNTQSGGTL